MNRIVHAKDFADEAAQYVASTVARDLMKQDRFILGLCGGNTPEPVYERLAQSGIEWEKVIITFGDERCVPPDHAESNFRMASDALLSRIPIPEKNILRMQGEMEPKEAAFAYESLLKETLGEHPAHDLMLLGMGGDGHTASLFPGTEALNEKERLVAANVVPKLGATRLTMTFPLINASRRICVLVNDAAKKPMVDAVLAGADYPAAKVAGVEETVWILGY